MQLNLQQKIINMVLTLIQYGSLLYLLYAGPWLAHGVPALSVEMLGVALALWAIVVMNESRLHIAPRPRAGAKLIEKGPYRLIRHPMYLSIIMAVTPIALTRYDNKSLLIMLVLYANLILKMLFEESLLKAYFKPYTAYMKRTWRLLPYVF